MSEEVHSAVTQPGILFWSAFVCCGTIREQKSVVDLLTETFSLPAVIFMRVRLKVLMTLPASPLDCGLIGDVFR